MKIHGIVKVVKKDASDNVTYDSGWMDNNVFVGYIRNMVGANSSTIGPNIVLSEWEGPSSASVGQLIRCHSIGSNVVAPSSSGAGLIGDPYVREFQQTFAPPPSTITINTIGLTGSSSIDDGVVDVDAFTKLGSSCTQSPTETLIVFYRIQLLQEPGSEFTRQRAFGIFDAYIAGDDSDFRTPRRLSYTWAAKLPKAANGASTQIIPGIEGEDQILGSGRPSSSFVDDTWDTGVDDVAGTSWTAQNFNDDPLYFARRHSLSAAISDATGAIRSSTTMTNGSAGTANSRYAWWQKLLPDTEGFVQNIYSHGPTADKPFFDPGALPTSDGTLAIDSSGWTNPDFNQMFRIDIDTSGAVGVGEYRFRRRRVLGGFHGNTYANRAEAHPAYTAYNPIEGSHAFFRDNSTYGYPWTVVSPEFIIHPDDAAILISNMITCEMRLFDAEFASLFTTGDTFAATSIQDVEYDNIGDVIWFACEDTGIWSISDPWGSPVITNYDATTFAGGLTLTNNAYTITVGRDGGGGFRKVWAIVEGGLVGSDDGGATWEAYDDTTVTSFSQPIINGNWTRAMKLKGHPTDINDKIAVVYDTGGTAGGFNYEQGALDWWTPAGDMTGIVWPANDSLYRQSAVDIRLRRLLYHRMIDVSPNDGEWWWSNGHDSLGTATFNGTSIRIITDTAPNSWIPATGLSGGTNPNGSFPSSTSAAPNGSSLAMFFTTDDNGDDAAVCIGQFDRFWVIRPDGTPAVNEFYDDLFGATGIVTGLAENCFSGFKAWIDDFGIIMGGSNNDQGSTSFSTRLWQPGRETQTLGIPGLEHILWDTYGWDGAQWVLDNPNGRPIHSTSEPLIDGLTISFDDAGGTQTFVAGDYYTTGVVDGIWLDGNTQFDYNTTFYMKPTTQNFTDLTTATVPVSTSLAITPVEIDADVSDWVDVGTNTSIVSGRDVRKDNQGGDGGARLNLPSEGDFDLVWQLDGGGTPEWARAVGNGNGTVIGVSSAGTIGSSLDRDTVQYGFFFDGQAAIDDPVTLHVRESGVNVVTVETNLSVALGSQNIAEGNRSRFRISRRGTDIEYYFNENLVHTTSGIPGGTYVPEIVATPGSEARVLIDWSPTWTDYWAYVGDGVTTGRYAADYLTLDPIDFFSLEINGSEGVQSTRAPSNVTLTTGEYSVHPEQGAIRLSGSDAGDSLALDCTIIRT